MAKKFEHLAPLSVQLNMRRAQARLKKRAAQGRKPAPQAISGQPAKRITRKERSTPPVILGVTSRGGGRRN